MAESVDALERCYNSGRFLETAAYAMAAAGLSPFVFYCRLVAPPLGDGRGINK